MDFPDCPVALAYGFAVQACHLRDRLKMYEDICFADDRRERLPLDVLRDLVERTVPSLSSDGDVRVVSVTETHPEQMRIGGNDGATDNET